MTSTLAMGMGDEIAPTVKAASIADLIPGFRRDPSKAESASNNDETDSSDGMTLMERAQRASSGEVVRSVRFKQPHRYSRIGTR